MAQKQNLKPWTNYLYRHQSKMSSSNKVTCRGTLRRVFIRVYRLEIQVNHVGIFDPALWTVDPLTFSLVQILPPSPRPCVNKYTVYTMQGYGVLPLRRKVPLQVKIFGWRQFALPSMSLIFLRLKLSAGRACADLLGIFQQWQSFN
jgi:hypothetical protein